MENDEFMISAEGAETGGSTQLGGQEPSQNTARVTSSSAVAGGAENPAHARARELVAQAETLRRATGRDLMGEFSVNPVLREKVLSGEWDFADACRAGRTSPPPPAPVRSGGSLGALDVSAMSGEQFARLNEMLASGSRIGV